MRKFKTVWMRRSCGLILGALMGAGFFTPSAHADIPVYLKLESRFPSGVHPRDWLESRTKITQMQRWFRVESNGTFGWLAEDHVLTLMKLSSIARTVREEPDRSSPSLDALRAFRIPKGSQVIVLEIAGSWSRARILGDGAPNHESWILNEVLVRDPGNQIERGLVFREAPIRLLPRHDKPAFDRVAAYKEISVLNSVANSTGQWLEIQVDSGSAWIERKNVWLPQDLADGSLRTNQPGLELRSAPIPNADVVKRLSGMEILKIVGSKYLRWGRVKVPEHGMLWWPISDDHVDDSGALPPLKLTTQDLLSRNIYDMASSASIPGLRFASAQGVFKSRDGIQWSMIPKFENGNYPIAISKSGVLFVGPYVSMDHGENFEQWIRWDHLVEVLKRETGAPPARLRLSALEALDAEGKVINLEFDVGRSKRVKISTPDRGLSWKLL